MKLFSLVALACLLAVTYTACDSPKTETAATFCDTACLKDSMKYEGDHKLAPYVYISANNCAADTITWGYDGSSERKMSVKDYLKEGRKLNKDFVNVYFRDTAVAIIQFNDCSNGRGYVVRLPFAKSGNIKVIPTALTRFDKKFVIPAELVVTTDRGNIFVEDLATGKQAQMTFGKALEIDYDYLHDVIDSVNISATKIWAKVKIDGKWETKEKAIELK